MCVCVVCGCMKHESSNSKFFKTVNRFISSVASHGTANRYVIAREIGITPRQYEQIAPYMIEAYADILSYDSSLKTWTYIAKGFINKDIVDEPEITQEIDIKSEDSEVKLVDY